ncbi:hypothetical protein G4D82_10550 [Flavobacterium sp. CYK-4]|uniref:GEVED domain-containing protein n=1 Tax=Flavobacterium lotistagni TaxID=2709660 RepID=UPI00140AD3DE|nr:GEVED domain-containing protein [Flavobacterium lotistagni]NHM07663.1 hypothetical protein [Flavobacterium lotistagni]
MNVNYNSLSSGRDTWLRSGIGDTVGSPPTSSSKNTRKSWLVLLLMFLFLATGQWANAQNITNYVYSTGTNGTLEDLSSGSTTIMTGVNDDTAGTITAIGFDFYFMGGKYTHFSANSNGQMVLHASASATAAASQESSLTANRAILAPMTGDNEVGNGIRIKVIGTAPNRKLVVEWNQFYVNFVNITNAGNMQVWIEETTGIVTYMYGELYNSASTSQTRSIFIASSNTATTAGSITISATPTFAASATLASNTIAAGSGATTGSPLVANMGSSSQGSRRFFQFTPGQTAPTGDASSLTFTAVTLSTITPNWVDNAVGESFFVVTRALDAGFTTGVVTSVVASTTSAGTGTAYSLAQTGLSPGTTYYYKIQAGTEALFTTGITGSQATTAGTTYYWVGASGSTWGLASNWNTNPAGGGSNRTTPASSDILIVDGAGTTSGGSLIISHDVAAQTIGQFKVTSNTNLTLQSSITTTRTTTISGGGGDDLVVEAGSTLNLSNAANAAAFAFSGTGNTGLIAGTYNAAGSTSNLINTTGGTGTLVTVTGSVNNNIAGSSGCMTGSTATLAFASGSNYSHGSFTTTNGFIPLATWDTTSTVTITGGTTSTGITNPTQSFGNFVYNSTTSTGTQSVWTSGTTAVIKGNLTVTATGTGIFRAVTSGTVTVNGNVNINGGTFQSGNGTTSTNGVVVLGNTNIGAAGTLNINSAFYSQRGTTFTNDGTLTGTASPSTLQFFSPTNVAQTFAGSGTVLTNIGTMSVQNTSGLTITHTNQIPLLRVNLFNGAVTNSNKITFGTGAALNTTVQIGYAGNVLAGGSFDAAPTFNLGTGTHGVIYAQELAARTTGFEIPTSRALGFLTQTNSNGLTIAGGNLSATTLTFNALSGGNINTDSSNVLTVTGTTTGSIVRTLATAYVNGPLALTLPASLVTGSTYTFPIGKSALNTFSLVNPTTNAGGTVTVQAEAFDGNAGGTPGLNISAISSTKYWAASITNGSANFTDTLIRLNDDPTGRDAIAASTTVNGAYDIQGGVTVTTTSNTMETTAPKNTTLPGFFLMGNKAAASLANLTISPSGNQCANAARTVTVEVTPGGAAVTGVVINYSVNGTAQTAITMTNTTGNGFPSMDVWSGVIPTVSPVNATVAWSVTATDGNGLVKTQSGVTYKDEPLFGMASATASSTTVCASNTATTLTATLSAPGSATIGTQTTTEFSGSVYRHGFGSGDFRHQLIYTAAELTAAGVTAGNLTSIGFNVTSVGSGAYTNYTISLGAATSTTAVAAFQTPSLTQVYTQASFTPVSGVNTHTFQTPYAWDGVSDVLVNICYTVASASGSSTVAATTPATVRNSQLLATAGACTAASGTTFTNRPLATFGYNAAPAITSVSWNDGTNTFSGNNVVVNPTTTTTYTPTITAAGCTITPSGVTVTVNPVPSAPVQGVTDATCGTAVPLVSVTDPNAFTTPTFKWYADNVTTTALQSSTSATYTTAISATTNFYVSVVDPATGCESARTLITATVNAPDSIDTIANQSVCIGSGFTVTASSLNASYTYTWTSTTGSGITTPLTGASQTITPTAAGTYTYTVTATDGFCTTSTTFTATVTAYPVLTSTTATPAAVCANGISTLTATVPSVLSFSTSTGASLDPMTGATTVLTTSNDDDVTVSPLNIGFNFVFNGVTYSQYSVSPDGWIKLGSTAATNEFTNSVTSTSNIPRLYPYWDDLATGSDGSVKTLVTGTAPNRIFIVQWNVTIPRAVSGAANSTFQAWLYETTNVIEYRYGTFGAQTAGSASVGYSINGTNFSSVTLTSNTTSTTTANNSNAGVPASGRMFTFTPPSPVITWAPTTDLYTDAAATIPYTGGSAATVYSKPTANRTYNATLEGTNGCNTVSAAVTVTQNNEAVDAITGGATSVCLGTPSIPSPIQFVSSVGVEWISSNPAVATIDVDGILTPLTVGSTTISARIVNTTTGCTSYAPNTVTVNVYAPIAITTQPLAQSVLEYDGVNPTDTTFSVVASGSVSGYQWQVSPSGATGTWSDILVTDPLYTGQTSATLHIPNATIVPFNGLYYRAVVSSTSPCTGPVESNGALLTVSDLTTSDPAPQTICGSGSVSFSTVSTPTSGVTYQWFYAVDNNFDYQEITGDFGSLTFPSGVTGSTLDINGVSATENGWYFIVVATYNSSQVVSNPALLTVNTAQTVETTGPGAVQNVTICGNAAATSTFLVSGTGATGFQWQYSSNGADWDNVAAGLPTGASYTGANGTLLTVNTTAALGAGPHYYRCRVSGPSPCPAIDSNTAELIVTTPTIVASPSTSLICSPSGAAVTLTASGAGVGGTYVWSPTTGLTGTGDTVSANPTVTTTYTVTGTTAAGCISTATATVTVAPDMVATSTISATPSTVCSGTDSQLVASSGLDGSSSYCIPTVTSSDGTDFINNFSFGGIVNNATGQSAAQYGDFTSLTANVTAGVVIPLSIQAGSGSSQQFGVWIDYDQDGTFEANEFKALTTSGTTAVVNNSVTVPTTAYNGVTRMRVASRFSTAVASTISCANPGFGEYEDYSVNITGATTKPTYTYSWSPTTFLSNPNIANPIATGVTATTEYTVTISSSTGCSTTKTVTVSVAAGIAITTQPTNVSACQGTTATFTVAATGANLTYQWRKGGVDLFGEINPTLNLLNVTSANDGTYDVVINSSCGDPAVTSDAVTLVVNPIPTATAPSAQTACAGVTTTAIPLTGTPSGVTFNITGGAAIGLANVTGVTEIPSFTTVAGTATISVTPVANGCTGTAVTFVYTVNPLPATPTAGSNSPVCSTGNINLSASTVTISGYSMNSNSGVSFIDINTTGTSVGTVSDDSEHNITMPAFTFNGISYTAARVGMNGAIALGSTTGDISTANAALPSTANGAGNIFLAPLWDDLDIQSGASVKTQTVGNLFIIQYTTATHDDLASTTDSVTFQVQLNTVTGTITYVYPDVTFGDTLLDFGAGATVGIQWSSTGAVQYSNNTASLAANQSITFTPNTAAYTWSGPDGFTSSLQNPSLPATALAAGTYTVYVTNPATGCSSASSTTTVVVDTATTWYADADTDGFGNAAVSQLACTQPVGYVANNTDCDDTNVNIYQFATFYVDADGDTYGSTATASVCSGLTTPAGYSTTNDDCDDTNPALNPTNPCSAGSVVNLTLFIEGYYIGGSTMNSVKLNQDYVSPADEVEDLTIELHDATTYALVDTAIGTLKTDGSLTCTFNTAAAGSYYIVVKGSNIIETWSATAQAVGTTPLSYDFSSGASQAYGDNMREIETGVFAMYTGDLNLDQVIDNADLDSIFPDIENSNFGVLATDLNGDGVVDNADLDNIFINIENSIFANYPF